MPKDHTPEYMKQLAAKILEINYKNETLKMSFEATEDICHPNGSIIQGGFTTVMMDSCMAFLVMDLTDFIYESKIIKLGKSIGFSSAELYQSEKIIAKASSSLKLIKLGEPKDFLIDNMAKDAKIIKA